MRLPLLEWAFNFRNNTVDIVIELIIILKWTEKNLASRDKIRVLPNDALVMGWNEQNEAILQSVSFNCLILNNRRITEESQLILLVTSVERFFFIT